MGRRKIAPYKEVVTDQHNIGESWELSGVKGHESVIDNGEFEGKTITELVEQFKGQLVGEKVYANTGNEFPLLIKFIDAKSDLSIQVHPDDELAARRHNSKGKTEMWYVVGADEGAHLLSGLSEKITPEEYVKRVENNTITDVLTNFNVKAGDVFFLPAGRIHAIGTGCSSLKSSRPRTSPTASMTTDASDSTASHVNFTRSWPKTPSTTMSIRSTRQVTWRKG